MKMMVIILLFCTVCSCSNKSSEYTLKDGLEALKGVNGFAVAPFGRMNLISSYDRSGGNDDGSNYLGRSDDGKRIMADIKGPGCVRRLWFTGMPEDTKLYFYFDNEKKPRLVTTYKEIRGDCGGLFSPPLCAYPSGAGYCYIPMPFAKRLVIMGDDLKQGTPFFYHVNYELFPKKNRVKSFTVQDLEENKASIEDVARVWNKIQHEDIKIDESAFIKTMVPKKGRSDLYMKQGSGVLSEITIKPDFGTVKPAVERNKLLRDLLVNIYWDDSVIPAVSVPFGDLFCNSVRPVSFKSMAISVESGRYQIKFPMPFKKSARIELQNDSAGDIEVSMSVLYSESTAVPEYYFHAYWGQSTGSGRPHEILSVHDEGIYVGCYLNSIGMDGSWNILESDECIYRDEDVADPSMHGTGLEDYFNGGWYYNSGPFQMPLAGALEKSGIRATQFRWHLSDRIDFKNRIYINIEFGHGNASRGYMSSVAYWYGKNPAGLGLPLAPANMRMIPQDPLEPTCMMCELFNRERDGKLIEAMELCREYSEKYKDMPDALAMDIRAIAYQEKMDGYEAVKDIYEKKRKDPRYKDVALQIDMLEWFHQSESNSIASVHVNGRCVVYIDEQEVFSGDSPFDAMSVKTYLTPGKHVVAARVDYLRPDPWFSLNLRTHYGDFVTDKTWKFADTVQDGWNKKGFDDSSWKTVHSGGPLPFMRYFQFKPNVFIFSQHRAQLLGPPVSWPVGRTVYFRKTIEVKAE